MTLKEFRDVLAAVPSKYDDLKVTLTSYIISGQTGKNLRPYLVTKAPPRKEPEASLVILDKSSVEWFYSNSIGGYDQMHRIEADGTLTKIYYKR